MSAGTDTLVVGEGGVTAAMPQGRCGPMARSPSILTWTSGAPTADLHRSAGGPEAVPEEYVGVWVPANELCCEKEMVRIAQGPAGGRLVRISAEAGMGGGTEQYYCESSYVVGAVSPVLALGPGTYTADSGEDCRQPDAVFLTVAAGRKLLCSVAVDAEPGPFVRTR